MYPEEQRKKFIHVCVVQEAVEATRICDNDLVSYKLIKDANVIFNSIVYTHNSFQCHDKLE